MYRILEEEIIKQLYQTNIHNDFSMISYKLNNLIYIESGKVEIQFLGKNIILNKNHLFFIPSWIRCKQLSKSEDFKMNIITFNYLKMKERYPYTEYFIKFIDKNIKHNMPIIINDFEIIKSIMKKENQRFYIINQELKIQMIFNYYISKFNFDSEYIYDDKQLLERYIFLNSNDKNIFRSFAFKYGISEATVKKYYYTFLH